MRRFEQFLEGVAKFSSDSFDATVWEKFAEKLHYFQGNLDVSVDFPKLENLQALEGGAANRLYYLATAPEHYAIVASELGAGGMANQGSVPRFGGGSSSRNRLGMTCFCPGTQPRWFTPSSTKARSIALTITWAKRLRRTSCFSALPTPFFEPVWNRRYVDNVQITVGRDRGRGSSRRLLRHGGSGAGYVPKPFLQLLALVAMEPPARSTRMLCAMRRPKCSRASARWLWDTVRGQYVGYGDGRRSARFADAHLMPPSN